MNDFCPLLTDACYFSMQAYYCPNSRWRLFCTVSLSNIIAHFRLVTEYLHVCRFHKIPKLANFSRRKKNQGQSTFINSDIVLGINSI